VTTVHVVVPDGIDDPARLSGGNRYDREVRDGLRAAGWHVVDHAVAGAWPLPDVAAWSALRAVVDALPDGALVLLDGLVASTASEVLLPVAGRLRLVVLVHLPFGLVDGAPVVPDAPRREQAVLAAAAGVVTTSCWTRTRLVEGYGLPPGRVHVAQPGVHAGALATSSEPGTNLLCVGPVTRHKGHDVLVEALGHLADRPWRCVVVGPVDREPEHAAQVEHGAAERGLADRFVLAGPLWGTALDDAYCGGDVLVLPSLVETYGMVVTEALSHGLPVLASATGGVPEALGRLPDGRTPGLLVAPGDVVALAQALASWLDDGVLRRSLRRAVIERRAALRGWASTTADVSRVLEAVAA
jgi:glycosyltransferase involved in cell wall biosynthesis